MENNVRLHLANGIIVEGPPGKVAELVGDVPSLKRRTQYYRGRHVKTMSHIALRNAIVEMVYMDLLEMGRRETVTQFLEGSNILEDPVFDALVAELQRREEAQPGLRFYESWRGHRWLR